MIFNYSRINYTRYIIQDTNIILHVTLILTIEKLVSIYQKIGLRQTALTCKRTRDNVIFKFPLHCALFPMKRIN